MYVRLKKSMYLGELRKNTEVGWERRMISEQYELFGDKPMGQFVNAKRLEHVARMKNSRSAKTMAWKKPPNRRKSGCPRKRCKDPIEEEYPLERRSKVQKEMEDSRTHLGLKGLNWKLSKSVRPLKLPKKIFHFARSQLLWLNELTKLKG